MVNRSRVNVPEYLGLRAAHNFSKLAILSVCSSIMMSNSVYASEVNTPNVAVGAVNVDSLKHAQNVKHIPINFNKEDASEYVLETH